MPADHQFVKGLSPGWIIAQASKIGQGCVEAVTETMRRCEHVQQGFNASLGILSLARAFTAQRLEMACQRCLHFRTLTYRALKSVLVNNLDRQPWQPTQSPEPSQIIIHENLRRDFVETLKAEVVHV
jgi:glutamate-1-semialdehyde aminotransferase